MHAKHLVWKISTSRKNCFQVQLARLDLQGPNYSIALLGEVLGCTFGLRDWMCGIQIITLSV